MTYRTSAKPPSPVRRERSRAPINWKLAMFVAGWAAIMALVCWSMATAPARQRELDTCVQRGGVLRTQLMPVGRTLIPISTCEGATR